MIKKVSMMVGALGVLAFLLAPPSWAQAQAAPPAQGRPAYGKPDRMYNPQAAQTITGKVVSVTRRTPKRPGRPAMVSLVLQTDKGTVRVHLGPADYLDQQALKLAAGDQVSIKGIRHTRGNRTTFIAGEVTKGGQVLKLRDDVTGRPLWFKGRKPISGT